ncbi:MAG: EAL domain-containing protein [Thiomicrospira sp.]|uniref:EAL domain-containing protein n=1 Tax=Thiomicrospira sp. TaxID=935 RepID=UPI001A0C1F07|nr:EAL domain-containing protein [Thiomicrospira sp.]MBE0493813.1 EAL domain-containing protein [Thiomicrospira sp.]
MSNLNIACLSGDRLSYFKHLVRWLCLSWVLGSSQPLLAEQAPHFQNTINVGVLAFRSAEQTEHRWQPLIHYLNQQLPEYDWQIKVYYFEDFNRAAADQTLHYVLTNPQHFVLLKNQFSLKPLLTLMPLAEGIPVTEFGGVIFTRANANGINQLSDIGERTTAATFPHSFGGYLMQRWEMYKQDTRPKQVLFTGMPHDNVVKAVLNNEADVGFVRTGVLESMIKEGSLSWNQIKLIQPSTTSRFPQVHSTELYPEWPFAASANSDADLNKKLSLTLLNLSADHPVAKHAEIYGFSPPGNYQAIEAVMLRLDVLPRDDFGWRDIVQRYGNRILLAMLFIGSLLLVLSGFLVYYNRRANRIAYDYAQLNQQLQSVNQNLEGLVERRTHDLLESEQRFRQMFEKHASPMLLIDPPSGEIIDANQAAAEFYGYKIEQLTHMSISQINTLSEPEVAKERTLAAIQKRNYFVFTHQLANGEQRYVDVHSSPVVIGGKTRLFSIIHDSTSRIQFEERLKLHDTALNYAANAIAITDQQGVIIWANKAYSRLTGYSSEEITGKLLYPPDDVNDHDKALYVQIQHVVRQGQVWHGVLQQTHKNGDLYYEEVTITPVRDQQRQISNFVAVVQDITERRLAEQQIQNLAFFDPLTNLPNRRLLIDRLETVMALTDRRQFHAALIFLDLDHFKVLNDSYGHHIGDRLLVDVAKRIKSCLRSGDTVARFGGDEFVILLTELDQEPVKAAQQAKYVAEKMREALGQVYFIEIDNETNKIEYTISASMGITIFQGHDKSLEDLLKWSDMAMYQAKASGRNEVRLFDPAMQTQLDERASLEQDLRKAIEQHQLELYYQPQVDVQQRILGAEALLRWQHPERGFVSPGLFIPLAEETGLILNLGNWVLETACKQLAEWRHDPKLCLIQLAVNISAKQLRHPQFVEQIQILVKQYEINPLMLKLELTESVLLSNREDSIAKMNALRLLGIQFSMDDFGTGYSSLAYLKQLPLSQIKIDQSFIYDLVHDQMDAVMVQAIMTLGQKFNMSVIAEGVENQQQFDILCGYKCEFFQGYLFGRPVPIEHFKQLVLSA